MSNPTITSGKVAGTDVYNPDGEKVGSIDDLIIDKRSGLVRFATLDSGGFLGMGGEHYAIPWQALTYDTQRAGYVVPLAQLDKVSPREAGEAPEGTHERGHRIDEFFGEKSI